MSSQTDVAIESRSAQGEQAASEPQVDFDHGFDSVKSLIVKDILYRSKRFRMAMLGEENATRTIQEPKNACLDMIPSNDIFYMYPKINGNLCNKDAAVVFGSLFRDLPSSVKRHIVLYV